MCSIDCKLSDSVLKLIQGHNSYQAINNSAGIHWMLLRRALFSAQYSPRFIQLPIPAIRSLSTTLLMPPKRSTRAKANENLQATPSTAEMNGSSHPTSMLHALAHIPPAPPGPALPHAEEDDDLTPPPELSSVKAAPSRKGKSNGKGKATAEPVQEDALDSEELASKRKEIEHKAVEEITEEIQGKRRKARVSYAEAAPDGEEVEEELEARPSKKGKQTPKKVKDEYEPEQETEAVEDEPAPTTPKKGGKKKAAKPTEEDEEEGEEKTPKEKKPRKPTPKKSRLAIMNDEPEFDEDGNEIVKKKRKAKVYAKVEYVIPDVPKKTTNFKGQSLPSHAVLGSLCRSTRIRVFEYCVTVTETR
jgi:UV DNA damage endonuclease